MIHLLSHLLVSSVDVKNRLNALRWFENMSPNIYISSSHLRLLHLLLLLHLHLCFLFFEEEKADEDDFGPIKDLVSSSPSSSEVTIFLPVF